MPLNSIEDLTAQGMFLGQSRVIEIRGWIVDHSDVFHHAARAQIFGNCERDQAVESSGLKGVADNRAGCFSGQAVPPVVEREAPANLHRGRERRVERWDGEADEADERLLLKKLGGKQAEAVTLEMLLYVGNQVVGLAWREQAGHKLHDARVGVHRPKRLTVRGAPAPKLETGGGQGLRHDRRQPEKATLSPAG